MVSELKLVVIFVMSSCIACLEIWVVEGNEIYGDSVKEG
jgi:hypothetical protein